MTYEAVTARPAGDSTVARLALTAAEYGYEGIVVRNPGDRPAEYDREAIADEYGIDVVEGVAITAVEPSRASGLLGNHRPDTTVVAVRGGTAAMNRFAVEQPAVDVLSNPLGFAGPTADGDTGREGDPDVDHVLAKTAAENGVHVEISLAPLIGDAGGSRVRAIQSLRRLRKLVDQYDTPYVVTADARSHLGMRSPRDLSALGDVVGFDPEGVAAGLAEWAKITTRNRKRRSDAFLEPGVCRCDDE